MYYPGNGNQPGSLPTLPPIGIPGRHGPRGQPEYPPEAPNGAQQQQQQQRRPQQHLPPEAFRYGHSRMLPPPFPSPHFVHSGPPPDHSTSYGHLSAAPSPARPMQRSENALLPRMKVDGKGYEPEGRDNGGGSSGYLPPGGWSEREWPGNSNAYVESPMGARRGSRQSDHGRDPRDTMTSRELSTLMHTQPSVSFDPRDRVQQPANGRSTRAEIDVRRGGESSVAKHDSQQAPHPVSRDSRYALESRPPSNYDNSHGRPSVGSHISHPQSTVPTSHPSEQPGTKSSTDGEARASNKVVESLRHEPRQRTRTSNLNVPVLPTPVATPNASRPGTPGPTVGAKVSPDSPWAPKLPPAILQSRAPISRDEFMKVLDAHVAKDVPAVEAPDAGANSVGTKRKWDEVAGPSSTVEEPLMSITRRGETEDDEEFTERLERWLQGSRERLILCTTSLLNRHVNNLHTKLHDTQNLTQETSDTLVLIRAYLAAEKRDNRDLLERNRIVKGLNDRIIDLETRLRKYTATIVPTSSTTKPSSSADSNPATTDTQKTVEKLQRENNAASDRIQDLESVYADLVRERREDDMKARQVLNVILGGRDWGVDIRDDQCIHEILDALSDRP
ncbi:uncharacterized protein EV422DRAFT_600604 [Fimicolochytrium jonesii]|uniref:uncharacterized protein n=1 Tax=Fimicolochytrium jonesii TaxID=1396493 RepID=UPI0022FE2F51|nr:uncharacterized protein EV422DRAFT_600604 [Fimicolochytrium jonesii]KAI8825908.1 hypothetical protein EV422DRAFT_600604 [Fimicolochytrium jonesii]